MESLIRLVILMVCGVGIPFLNNFCRKISCRIFFVEFNIALCVLFIVEMDHCGSVDWLAKNWNSLTVDKETLEGMVCR